MAHSLLDLFKNARFGVTVRPVHISFNPFSDKPQPEVSLVYRLRMRTRANIAKKVKASEGKNAL